MDNRSVAHGKLPKECLYQIDLDREGGTNGEIFKIKQGYCDRHVDKSTFDAMKTANPKCCGDWERHQAVPAGNLTSEPMKIIKTAVRGEINVKCSDARVEFDKPDQGYKGIILQNCPS